MSIKSSPPPQDAINGLRSGLGQIRTMPGAPAAGGYTPTLSAGHEPHWDEGLPHQVYNLGLDAIRDGKGLDAAQAVGWRFLLGQPSQDPTVAAEIHESGGQHEFSGLNRGPFVAQTLTAIKQAETTPEIRDGDFEPRVLRIPALYVVALWLKERSTGKDILIPLDPAPTNLTPGRHYTADEFAAELLAMGARMTGPSPHAP